MNQPEEELTATMEGGGVSVRHWYEAETLMADLTSHRHEIPGASEEEIEQRIRSHYPDAVATWCAKGQDWIRQDRRLDSEATRGKRKEDSR